ncbi:hypothetical protein BKA56DRAFT_610320 [Ilyonectria sp. MPI-CAGE-AT-0026]|nr:hypothetical protein BKA56DRAFT_610320 [Ilyonectria sp. MPI-CAGE-AT-0026]
MSFPLIGDLRSTGPGSSPCARALLWADMCCNPRWRVSAGTCAAHVSRAWFPLAGALPSIVAASLSTRHNRHNSYLRVALSWFNYSTTYRGFPPPPSLSSPLHPPHLLYQESVCTKTKAARRPFEERTVVLSLLLENIQDLCHAVHRTSQNNLHDQASLPVQFPTEPTLEQAPESVPLPLLSTATFLRALPVGFFSQDRFRNCNQNRNLLPSVPSPTRTAALRQSPRPRPTYSQTTTGSRLKPPTSILIPCLRSRCSFPSAGARACRSSATPQRVGSHVFHEGPFGVSPMI